MSLICCFAQIQTLKMYHNLRMHNHNLRMMMKRCRASTWQFTNWTELLNVRCGLDLHAMCFVLSRDWKMKVNVNILLCFVWWLDSIGACCMCMIVFLTIHSKHWTLVDCLPRYASTRTWVQNVPRFTGSHCSDLADAITVNNFYPLAVPRWFSRSSALPDRGIEFGKIAASDSTHISSSNRFAIICIPSQIMELLRDS